MEARDEHTDTGLEPAEAVRALCVGDDASFRSDGDRTSGTKDPPRGI
jgi:hypothetical protein